MVDAAGLGRALLAAASDLTTLGRQVALVGGLAVSARAEVRFTRDVDLAVAVKVDSDAEALVLALQGLNYQVRATVEHEATHRLATARLLSPAGIKVDLLFASSGIEVETVTRADWIEQGNGKLPVARPEELGPVGLVALFPMPAALLREVVEALNDAALESAWGDDMTLGWVYQYWNDPEREQLDGKIAGGGKIEPHEIASKTQMFTERYMVE